MTLREVIAICKEMLEWIRYDGDEPKLMPCTPEKFGEAIDALIDLAERQLEMEDDIRRFKDKLKKAAEE